MIGRKSALVFANTVVGAVLGLVAVRLVAQFLGKELVNPVEFALGFFGLLFFITDLGFGWAHTKRVSEGLDEGDCLATFAVFKLVATAVFALISGTVVAYLVFLRPSSLEDATPGVLMLVIVYYVVKSLGSIPNATLDARRETARAQVSVLAENVIRIAATIFVALLFGGIILARGPLAGFATPSTPYIGWLVRNPSAALAGTYLLGTAASFAVAMVYVVRTTRFGRFRWSILKGYAEFALPIALVSAVAVVASNIDRAALGFFGAESEAALYGYARRISIFIETIPVAVAALLFPTVSGFHGRGENERIREIREQASRYVSMMVAPIVVFTIVFAPQIIHILLSDEWLPAVDGLRLLAIFSMLYALSSPFSTVLTGTGRTKILARIAVLMAVLNIVLNLLLIPDDLAPLGLPGVKLAGLKVTGAALATVTSMLVGYVLLRREASRFLTVRDVFLAKHLAAAIAMAAVLVALEALVIGTNPLAGEFGVRWYHLGAMGLAGTLVYAGVLALLRELRREDFDRLRDTIHPGEMFAYIRDELSLRRRR